MFQITGDEIYKAVCCLEFREEIIYVYISLNWFTVYPVNVIGCSQSVRSIASQINCDVSMPICGGEGGGGGGGGGGGSGGGGVVVVKVVEVWWWWWWLRWCGGGGCGSSLVVLVKEVWWRCGGGVVEVWWRCGGGDSGNIIGDYIIN